MTAKLMVHILDDDDAVRDSVKASLETAGYKCETYAAPAEFLKNAGTLAPGCALIDVRMPQMDGLAVLAELAERQCDLAVIIMTGFADVPLAVKAMKAGAVDFVEKPCPGEELIAAVTRALAKTKTTQVRDAEQKEAQERLARLTQREKEVLQCLVEGDSSKVIAHKLGISPRTVEIHRGRVMEKTQAKSLAGLVRLAIDAGIVRHAT